MDAGANRPESNDSAAHEVVRVGVSTMADASSGEPRWLMASFGDAAGAPMDWPGALLGVVKLLADPNRVAGGGGRGFAGSEQGLPLEPGTEEGELGAEADLGVEMARRIVEANELGGQLGRLVGAAACDAVRRAVSAGGKVRLEIVVPSGDPAAAIPWEWFSTEDKDQALALRAGCSVVRWVNPAVRVVRPTDRPAELRSAVVDLAWVHDPAFNQVREELSGRRGLELHDSVGDVGRVNVLHVLGHGREPRSGGAYQPPELQGTRPAELIEHLSEVGWPDLIVLVACRSAEGNADGLSFAAQLAAAGAPAVVGMAGDIETIGVAPSFLSGLWEAFDQGASIETAVQAGRASVALFGSVLSGLQWGLPVLTISTDALLPAVGGREPEIPRLTELAERSVRATLRIGGHARVDEAFGVKAKPGDAEVIVGDGVIEDDAVVGTYIGVDLT